MQRSAIGFLIALFIILLCPYVAQPGAAPGTTIEKIPQVLNPSQQNPAFLGDRLNKLAIPPAFVIGDMIFSSERFQDCSSPAGFLGVLQKGALLQWNWANQFCWKGNVNITQTNHSLDMTGKKIQLLATTIVVTGANPLSVTSLYELPFQSKNLVTFQIVMASGYKPRPAYPPSDPRWAPPTPDFLYAYFSRPYGVALQVQYNGAIYATLKCSFTLSRVNACAR